MFVTASILCKKAPREEEKKRPIGNYLVPIVGQNLLAMETKMSLRIAVIYKRNVCGLFDEDNDPSASCYKKKMLFND